MTSTRCVVALVHQPLEPLGQLLRGKRLSFHVQTYDIRPLQQSVGQAAPCFAWAERNPRLSREPLDILLLGGF